MRLPDRTGAFEALATSDSASSAVQLSNAINQQTQTRQSLVVYVLVLRGTDLLVVCGKELERLITPGGAPTR